MWISIKLTQFRLLCPCTFLYIYIAYALGNVFVMLHSLYLACTYLLYFVLHKCNPRQQRMLLCVLKVIIYILLWSYKLFNQSNLVDRRHLGFFNTVYFLSHVKYRRQALSPCNEWCIGH